MGPERGAARPGWGGDLLALAAGGVLPLAFAPFHWALVAVLSVALLFLLWRQVAPRRALWRGWLFGVGMFGVGTSWIYVSIHLYGNASAPLAGFLTALFVVVLAGFPAAAGGLARRFGGGLLGLAVGFPAWWTLLEWVRDWFLTGFPWLSLGYSQLNTPLGGLAPVLGVYGVSAATALTAGLGVAALSAGRGTRRWVCVAAMGLLWAGAGGLGLVRWTHPEGAPLSVSLLQGNVPQNLKWLPQLRERILERYAGLTEAHWASRLIIWPETAIPDFYAAVRQDFLAPLARRARERGDTLLIGVPVRDSRTQRYYNAVVQLGAGGPPAFYFKRHLVPFGEYVPLKAYLEGLLDVLDIPWSDFSPGAKHQPPLEVDGRQIGVSICYEDAFGAEIIRDLPAAQLLVNVSDDAWFGHSLAPYQHLEIARMRARETGRYLVRATNTGVSAIIGPRGGIRAEAPQFQVFVLSGVARFMTGATPYVRWGNTPLVVLAVLGAGIAAWRRR